MSSSAAPPIQIPSRWDRLSTGLKMWIILSIGLLPLGIIAVMASVENARNNGEKAEVEARALLATHVQRFTLSLARNAVMLRTARDSLLVSGDPDAICTRTLARLGQPPSTPGAFALYGTDPIPRCQTPGFVVPPPRPGEGQAGRALIAADRAVLDIFLYGPDGTLDGVAEYRAEELARVVGTPEVPGDFAVELVMGERVLPLRERSGNGPEASAEQSFANGDYALRIRNAVAPMSPSEIVAILAPVLMWLWASLIGWFLVQNLLLRPLRRMERVIAAYRPGDIALDVPTLRTPAQEIGELGQAFARMTQTVATHEGEMEAAVARQTRLVREVHHRVKNNLQVVASLLNLHARGAAGEEAAAAYASIQRRVDALAVVHRNHFAELEENRGVALKPLISELSSNLRATAPARAAGMQIRLDVASVHVTQDVAVSVAFLVTEIVEFGMLCGAATVSVALDREDGGTARLSVEADSLAGQVECDEALADRFERIITGLARQLRSTLEREPESGGYAIRIAILDD
ncbi:MAG TPA: histidine kinase dimerization/phosphoacceptor domain -containing protein [Allosphingosinicella sp.]|nr:histidine kinase dimerization/phosphoacceptor domain -containing protein [Allosphingosinicella sp.]